MKGRLFVLLWLILAATLLASAQVGVAPKAVPALQFRHPEHSGRRAWQVDYVFLTDVNEPAFRLRVHHYHAWCNGYLYITPTRIAYDPVFTPAQKDGFSIARSDLQEAQPRFAGYQFTVPGKTFKFAFLGAPDSSSGDVDEREALLRFLNTAITNFAAAQRYFVAILAGLDPATGSPPAKPAIHVLDPVGVQSGATADMDTPVQSLVGVVAVAGGVRSVTANEKPATLTVLSPDIVLFQTPAFELPPGTVPMKIAVIANNDTHADFAFNATRPQIAIAQPGGSVRDAAVTLHGTVVGLHNIQKLNVAGKTVELQKKPDGTFDFTVPNVPLELGTNVISGYAVQSNGERQVFDAAVKRMPPQKPLTIQQIEGGLKSGISAAVMMGLVKDRGVDFELTPLMEKRLRAAGADDGLLDAINDGYNK